MAMRREIRRMFDDGRLVASSPLSLVPFIGPYLYDGLKRTFRVPHAELTIRRFASRIAPMSVAEVKRSLQLALQNRRNNQCVYRSTTDRWYHIADYNVKGYEAMLALTRSLYAGDDGAGLGARFAFDARGLRAPPRREDATKRVSCETTRRGCARANGVYHDGLCQPRRSSARGFPGVARRSGQRIRRSDRRVRGQYARAPDGSRRWRRPGPMPKLRGRWGR